MISFSKDWAAPLRRWEVPGLRLGTTSCLIEADLLDNVRQVAPFFRDIELILYDRGGNLGLITASEVSALQETAVRYGLSYTVHLPSLMQPACQVLGGARSLLPHWLNTVALTAPLKPHAYVWHWEADTWGENPAANGSRWLETTLQLADDFLAQSSVAPCRLGVETLSYNFAKIWPFVKERGLGVTVDMGHLWKSGLYTPQLLNEWLAVAPVIHLHGVSESGADHGSLKQSSAALLGGFWKTLRALANNSPATRVVTLEMFSPLATEESLQCLLEAEESLQ